MRQPTIRYDMLDMVCYAMGSYGGIGWCGMVRYGTIEHGTVQYGNIRYDTVRNDTIRVSDEKLSPVLSSFENFACDCFFFACKHSSSALLATILSVSLVDIHR